MFGFVKKLFDRSKPTPVESAAPTFEPHTVASPPPQTRSAPVVTPVSPRPKSAPDRVTPVEKVLESPKPAADSAPVIQSATPPAPKQPGLDLSLSEILKKNDLKDFIANLPRKDITISIPLFQIESQLPKGLVKIPLSALSQAAPGGVFNAKANTDSTLVVIPLELILSRLDSKSLQRRTNQQKIAVPMDIAPIFKRPGMQEFTEPVVDSKEPGPSSATLSKSLEVPSEPAIVQETPQTGTPLAKPDGLSDAPLSPPKIELSTFPPAQVVEIPAPHPEVEPSAPQISLAAAVPPPPVVPTKPMVMPIPVIPKTPAISTIPAAPVRVIPPQPLTPAVPTPLPTASLAHPAVSQPVSEPAPLKLALSNAGDKTEVSDTGKITATDCIEVQIGPICGSWPEGLRSVLSQYGLMESSVYLPLNEVDTGIKRGKIAFPWEKIKGWIRNPQVNHVQDFPETILPLPLPVIVPLFMAIQSKSVAARKRISVSEAIPDVFVGQKAPAPSGESLKVITPQSPDKSVVDITPGLPVSPTLTTTTTPPIANSQPDFIEKPALHPKDEPGVLLAPAIPVPPEVPTKSVVPETPTIPQSPVLADSGASKPVPEVETIQTSALSKPVDLVEIPATGETTDCIELLINQIYKTWPEELRNELTKFGLTESSVFLPLNEVDPGIKRGKLSYSWDKIKGWIHAPQVNRVQHPLETVLSLPLSVVVPVFMARQSKSVASRKRITVSETIPDVFVGQKAPPAAEERPKETSPPTSEKSASGFTPSLPGSPSITPPISSVSEQSAASKPVTVAAPESKAASFQDSVKHLDLASLFGTPGKRFWTPPEIIDKVCAMPAVKGALVALDDGLLVAGKLPSPLNCETFAAFTPQIYGRINHFTKELKLGPPRSLGINIQDMAIHVCKAGNIFLMVITQEDQDFPVQYLRVICDQLEKQSKN